MIGNRTRSKCRYAVTTLLKIRSSRIVRHHDHHIAGLVVGRTPAELHRVHISLHTPRPAHLDGPIALRQKTIFE